jgi:hypothetical protein
MLVLAGLVAAVHAAAVVLLVVGGPLSLRYPRVLRVHVPVTLAIAAVYLLGADCPLTDLEQAMRERAGVARYDDGFLGHYVLTPLGLDRSSTGTQVLLLLTALVPNLAAVVVAVARRRKRVMFTT